MSIDWQAIEDAGGFGKGTPAKVSREKRKKARTDIDEAENDKVKARSKGQCEIKWFGRTMRLMRRCQKRGSQIHHMYGGIGVRGRGKSALAQHKQHVCDTCHPLLTGHVLRRVGGDVPMFDDEYERVDR